MTKKMHPDEIRTDGGTQTRAAISGDVVAEYADLIGPNDWPFPPVTVFYDGSEYWLADGFHRVAAARRANEREKMRQSIPVEVRQGTQRDAVLWSAGANAAHGLRRTNEDKRRAVLRLLEDGEWGQWSDREIGRRCGVSQPFVSKLRAELSDNGYQIEDERKVNRGGTVYTQRRPSTAKAPAWMGEGYPSVGWLETMIRGYVALGTIPAERCALVLRELADLGGDSTYWRDFGEYTRGLEWRLLDVKQALGGVADSIETEGGQAAAEKVYESAVDLERAVLSWLNGNPSPVAPLVRLGDALRSPMGVDRKALESHLRKREIHWRGVDLETAMQSVQVRMGDRPEGLRATVGPVPGAAGLTAADFEDVKPAGPVELPNAEAQGAGDPIVRAESHYVALERELFPVNAEAQRGGGAQGNGKLLLDWSEEDWAGYRGVGEKRDNGVLQNGALQSEMDALGLESLRETVAMARRSLQRVLETAELNHVGQELERAIQELDTVSSILANTVAI